MREISGARAALALLVIIGLLASGLAVLQSGHNDPQSGSGFSTFSSDRELVAYLNSHSSQPNALEVVDQAESVKTGAASHTDTNTQVAGIDEMDQVETDGMHIYIASSDRVDIIEVLPGGELRNASSISIMPLSANSYVYVQGIFLHGDRLAVIVSVNQYLAAPYAWFVSEMYYWGSTEISVITYDVSEPSSPLKMGERGVTGWYTSSRLLDDRLYLLTQQSTWDTNGPVKPMAIVDGESNDVPSSSVRYDPRSSQVQSYSNILSMDLVSLESNVSSILMGYGNVIYVSENAIYVTSTEWETVSFGEAIVSGGMAWTDIYRLDLNGMSVQLSGKGHVEGYLNNQFCMDEKDGFLRLTTCTRAVVSESMVFVLDRDLQIVGELRGLGLNETIQAARFINDTLYLVTFLQTDPLFIIDLSDPASPSLSGELVVPGFSSYLHDVGGGRLVGIGVENGTLKMSLYDVSDPAAPHEISKVMAPTWAWSVALWDHHAFMYDAVSGIIAVPVQLYGGYGGYQAGAYLFRLNDDSLDMLGLVQNRNESSQSRCMVIDGLLYTITDTSVSSWDLGDLSEICSLTFAEHKWALPGIYEDGARAIGAV